MIENAGPSVPARSRWSLERTALLVSAAIAVVAVGAAVRRDLTPPLPPATAARSPAETPAAAEDVAKAVAALEAHLKKNPDDAKGWRMLGWAYSQTQRPGEAVTAYRRATALDPGNAEGWSALGETLALAGPGDRVPADAEAAFKKALAIDPKDARARYFMAVARDLGGEHEGAIDDLVALLNDSPAGAPWVDNVRQAIARIAQQNGIDLSGRVPPSAAAESKPAEGEDRAAAVAALPPEQREAMIRSMVDTLAARLKAEPKDAGGWLRLMRARLVLGDREGAAQAYRDAAGAFASQPAVRQRIETEARAMGVPAV